MSPTVCWSAMSPMVSWSAMSPMVSCLLLLSVVVQTQGLTWTPDTTGQTAKKISVGQAGVFIIDKDNKLKEKKPASWEYVKGGEDVADISVGKEKIWVVMKNNTIYTWKSSWEKINGEMIKVCVNGKKDNDAWGLNNKGMTYKFSSGTWNLKAGWLRQITCGEAGVWGINPLDDVYSYKNGGFLGFLGWSKIDRKGNTFTGISSGKEVWAVDGKGSVFKRGSNGEWTEVTGQKMMQVDESGGDVWGVDSNNKIYEYK